MKLSRLIRNQWDRAGALLCMVSGLLALYLGWKGVSEHTLATEQLPYLASGALLGLFLLGISATLWLSADLRDTWSALHDIHSGLVGALEEPEVVPGPAIETSPTPNGRWARERRLPLRAPGR
jgi:hypothetical protein